MCIKYNESEIRNIPDSQFTVSCVDTGGGAWLIQLIQWHDMGIMDVGQLHLHPLQQSCTAQCSQLSSIERLPHAQLGNRIEFSQTKAQVSGLWSYYASPNLIFSMTIKNGFDLGPDLFISDLASKAQYGNAYRQTFSFSKGKSSLTSLECLSTWTQT